MRSIFALMLLPGLAFAGQGDSVADRVGAAGAEPVVFGNGTGGGFHPDRLVLTGAAGTLAWELPATASVQSEDRLDLSGTPVLGGLFAARIAPGDAARGVPLGEVRRLGDALVLDLGPLGPAARARVTGAPLVLTADLPRLGTVRFDLGVPVWAAAQPLAGGAVVGDAYVLDGLLVLAARGGGVAIPDLGRALDDLF